ncbi:MAG: hypothetical protein NVS2B11_11790 [Acetobacteraceae bacterium]
MTTNVREPGALGLNQTTGLNSANTEAILRNPHFQALVRSRSSLSWTLSIAILAIYLGFILLVAFDKPLLAMKIGGGATSLGIVIGLVVIVVAFLLTAIYVVRANGRFDDPTSDLRRELGQ